MLQVHMAPDDIETEGVHDSGATGSPRVQLVAKTDRRLDVVAAIEREARERPGLIVTLLYVCSRWRLDAETGEDLLSHLVHAGLVRSRGADTYELSAGHPSVE